MKAKQPKSEKRRDQRRQKGDRRSEVRWEPEKSVRRGSHGRRREDGWETGKKR